MNKLVIRPLVLALLVVAVVVFAACQEGDQITNVEAPPPPPPTVVTVSGACEVDGTTIACRDDSTSVPTEALTQVQWTLRRGSASIEGSITASPGANVVFGPGLAAGEYVVEQLVTSVDGVQAKATYSKLLVAP